MNAALALVTVLATGGLITAAVAVYRARSERRKTEAETREIRLKTSAAALKAITEAATVMYDPMTRRLAVVEEGIKACEARDAEKACEIDRLRDELNQVRMRVMGDDQ